MLGPLGAPLCENPQLGLLEIGLLKINTEEDKESSTELILNGPPCQCQSAAPKDQVPTKSEDGLRKSLTAIFLKRTRSNRSASTRLWANRYFLSSRSSEESGSRAPSVGARAFGFLCRRPSLSFGPRLLTLAFFLFSWALLSSSFLFLDND